MNKDSLNSGVDDGLLLEKLKKGHSKAFDQIFEKYYTNLCRFAYTKIYDADMSQSLTQNVFVKLWKRRFELGQINNLAGYLTTMVKNQVSDYLKQQKKNQVLISKHGAVEEDFSTENEILSKDFEECLMQALYKLPPRCREAFEYSRFENMTNKEIALAMKISVKGVEALIGRSLKILREELKEFFPHYDIENKSILFFIRFKK